MKYLVTIFFLSYSISLVSQHYKLLGNNRIEVSIDENGNLFSLKNKQTHQENQFGACILIIKDRKTMKF
jgi:hypothetical protein